MNWLVYWRGRWRIRLDLCPRCYSSPPSPACDICRGTYDYGPRMGEGTKADWRRKWDAAHAD